MGPSDRKKVCQKCLVVSIKSIALISDCLFKKKVLIDPQIEENWRLKWFLENLQPILWILKWANGLYFAAASDPNFVRLSTHLFGHMTHTANMYSWSTEKVKWSGSTLEIGDIVKSCDFWQLELFAVHGYVFEYCAVRKIKAIFFE